MTAHRKTEDDTLQKALHDKEIAEAKLRIFIDAMNEIRTPLTLITTPLRLLQQEDDDPHRRGIYETICRNAERILTLTNQITELAQLEEGKIMLHMCETEIISFLNDILTLFNEEAKAKMIFLNYYHDMEVLPVWVDRVYFEKMMVNLLSNAFKYSPVGGTIDLRVKSDGQQVFIVIRDTGVGIPEDKLPHIFDHFYQAHLSIAERNIGTGIGLDVTNQLIGLHHGTISVHNNTNGPGCEFTITLPLGCAHLTPQEMLPEKAHIKQDERRFKDGEMANAGISENTKKNSKQRIVLVESDLDVSNYLVDELQNDYEVIWCKIGKDGLAAVSMNNPDLIISDLRLIDMDGQALCSRLKSNSVTSHIPVILLTSNDPNQDRLELLEAAADAYVARPFNMHILRRTIVNLLHRQRMLKLKYGRKDQLEEMVEDIRVKSPDEKLLERIMQIINKNIGNADLSIDTIAELVGISRVHLHRKMKELTGQSPHDFVRSLRLKQAASLLAAGNMSISDVVYACGFSTPATFSTLFKKTYGLTPREYMTEHQE